MERGEQKEARQDFETVVLLVKPGTPLLQAEAHVGLARLDHRARAYDAALAQCKKALEAVRDYPAAYRQQAETLLAGGRRAKAAQALDRYLELEQRSPQVRRALSLAYKVRGILHAEDREYVLAIKAYGQSIDLNAEADTLTLRGWEYLRLGSPALALPDFKAAVVQAPASAEARCGRGVARVQLIRRPKKNPEATVSKEVREATADADEAERLARRQRSLSGDALRVLLLNCARVHARALGVLETVGLRPATNAVAAHYQQRALELLDQCMALAPNEFLGF
jgi:tetratricopeptide (TPR) repeat protein